MSGACEACAHPELKVIDAKLARRESINLLAERFQLSAEVLKNHRLHAQRPRSRFAEDTRSIIHDLVVLKETAAQRLREEEDGKGAAGLIREIRSISETIVRLSEPHKGCMSQADWDETQRAIVAALEKHPEAREAVLLALEDHERRRGYESL
jgi:hypothetical protein